MILGFFLLSLGCDEKLSVFFCSRNYWSCEQVARKQLPHICATSSRESQHRSYCCWFTRVWKTAYRFVVDCGKPNAVAMFLAPKPRVAMRSMAKRSSVDVTIVRRLENTCDLRETWLVVRLHAT